MAPSGAIGVDTAPQTVLPLPPGDSGFTYPVAQYDHTMKGTPLPEDSSSADSH